MAAVEIHDTRDSDRIPVEVTLLEGITPETATLFARTLQANNIARSAVSNESRAQTGSTTLLRTSRSLAPDNAGSRIHTVVAVNGRYVLQLSAVDVNAEKLDDYASKALDALLSASGPMISTATLTNHH